MSYFTLHNDADLFRASINHTAAETKFLERLIEKDYFCSLLLEYFSTIPDLVFKGGTCLAKVHADFYRLSEDLDFTIPMPVDSTRKDRQEKIKPTKEAFKKIQTELPDIRIKEDLTGANSSMQYLATLEYTSLITGNAESIKFEVSLREPLLENINSYDSHTILLNPVNSKRACSVIQLPCIAKREAYSEKFRAALTRREPAIRDYFDIDFAVLKGGLKIGEPELIELVKYKVGIPGNDKLNVVDKRLKALEEQIDSQLKAVLREKDFRQFDLKRSFEFVVEMHSKVS
ncbi:MAG: nucleotidyl transferase AbiEii/AbiGii toxin family protein [Bacteroidota bacterium]|nr:nucleotidyl transferase AbiEii/AbiGii toxin family protein [Bacteroidota bacterium]